MTGTDTVTGAPAAWYPDPAGGPLLRWWDGATWTSHTVDPSTPLTPAPALPAPATPAPVVHPVESMPYVPMAGFGAAATTVRPRVTDAYAAPTGSPLTVWVWLMAVFPVVQLVLALVVAGAFPDAPDRVLRYVLFSVAVVANLALAGRDAALLERRGLTAPRTVWAVIPLVYLIIRTVRVGRLSLWPLLVWTVTQLVLVALVVLAVLLPLLLPGGDGVAGSAGPDEAVPLTEEERAAELTQSGMEETLLQDFSTGSVEMVSASCAPLASTTPGATAVCVMDTGTELLELNILVTGADHPYTAFIVNGGRALD
jgi:hypothetical protein